MRRTTWQRLKGNTKTECGRLACRRCRGQLIEQTVCQENKLQFSRAVYPEKSNWCKMKLLRTIVHKLMRHWLRCVILVVEFHHWTIGQSDAPRKIGIHCCLLLAQWKFVFSQNASADAPAQIRMKVENSLPLSRSTPASFRVCVSKTTAVHFFFYCCHGCCRFHCRRHQVLFNFRLLTSFIKFNRKKTKWKISTQFLLL